MPFFTLFLALLGIAITIFFGISGIRYALKTKYKAEMIFFEEDCIPLFKSIEKNLDNIRILYEKKPISPSLILLKGCLINTGNIDIDRSNIHKVLTINFADKYRLISAKIVESSPVVNASCLIKENKLEFFWDLLKKREFIRFNTLINAPEIAKEISEIDIGKKIFESMSFSQRITNLEKIDKQRLPKSPSSFENMFSIYFMVPFLIILWIIFAWWSFYHKDLVIQYSLIDENGNSHAVNLSPKQDGSIEIKGVDDKYKTRLVGNEINKFRYLPAVKYQKKSIVQYISALFMLAIFIPAIINGFSIFFNIRKRKKIDHILYSK